MIRITHRHTSEGGDCGVWWIRDGVGEAHGTWVVGGGDIVANNTQLSDDEIDAILDSTDFWPGVPADDEWYTSEWDGETLVNVD